MSQIKLLDKLLTKYKLWTIQLRNITIEVENNIKQTSASNVIEEKIVSIVFSSILVYIVLGILGFFGVYTGGFVFGVIIFVIGLMLSRYLNNKIFGKPREDEDLNEEEDYIISIMAELVSEHQSITDAINQNQIIVNFTNYTKLISQMHFAISQLESYNTASLAIKYRLNHPMLVTKMKKNIRQFEHVYASKY